MKASIIQILIFTLLIYSCGVKKENDRDRFFLKGNIALAEKSYDDAKKFYSEAIKIDPNFALAFNNRGISHFEDDEFIMAVSDYSKAIRIDSSFTDAYYNRANSLLTLSRYKEANNDLERVVKVYTDSAYVHFALGLAYAGEIKNDKAIESFNKALELNPENVESYLNLAVIYYHKNEFDKASELLTEGYNLDQKNSNYYNIKGLVLSKQKKIQESIATFTEGLDKLSADPYILNNRGYVYLSIDSLRLAETDINQSLLLDPDNLWAYRNKGIIAYKRGDYNKAIRLYKRAYDDRNYVEDLFSYMAMAYNKTGNEDLSCKNYLAAQNKGESILDKPLFKYCL